MQEFSLPKDSISNETTNGGLSGLIPPVPTPTLNLEERGQRAVNLGGVEELFNHVASSGANGVFVAGGVGRGAALDLTQTEALVKRWIEVRNSSGKDKDSFPIVVNVGRRSIEESKEFARMADRHKVDGMFWLPSAHVDSIEAAISHMGIAVKHAPGIPIYWYHIPAVTGVFADWTAKEISDFCEKATEMLAIVGGTFGGLKCTINDPALVSELARRSPEFLILGIETTALDAFINGGGRAVVNLTACFSAKPYRDLLNAIKQQDYSSAQAQQDRMTAFLDQTLELSRGDMKRLVDNGHHLMSLLGNSLGDLIDGDAWESARLTRLRERALKFDFEEFSGLSLEE